MRTRHLRRAVVVAVVGSLSAFGLVACGSDEAPPETSGEDAASAAEEQCQELLAASEEAPASGADTFVFAASADPFTLNPFYASDGETFRVMRQLYEGLTAAKPCSADPGPGLATDWTAHEDGQTFDFTLREGVTFHDGTPFNAEAVCWNFDYWNNQPKGPAQSEDVTYYWNFLFKGFADTDPPGIFESCETDGEYNVTITLNQPFAGFVAAMTLSAFAIQSPTAVERWDDTKDGDDPTSSVYATQHPTGTGPYAFVSWDRGNQVRLKAYDGYWGGKAKTPNVVITTIEDPGARRDALANGEIDGYDLVAPGDISVIEEEGLDLVNRPAFNVLYLGMNQAQPPLDDPLVREAIAHAIDKDAIVEQTLPPGSEPAKEFIPPILNGYADDVAEYDYDPDEARDLLAEAGAEDLELDFHYPTDVSRPYMPSPVDTFNLIRTQLEDVGITVNPVADIWSPDYLDLIQGTPDHGIHLLGWNGDYNDTDNFLGVFFGQESNEWGFDNPELFQALSDARGLPTLEEQLPAYQDINRTIMEYLPGVPLAHPVPSLAFSPNVQGFVPSPTQDEVWNTVVVTE